MFVFWGVSEEEDSGYYGEKNNLNNSLYFEITYSHDILDRATYGYTIKNGDVIVNSVPPTTFDDYWVAKNAMNEALPIDLLDDIGPDYDPSIYERFGNRKVSGVFWGKAPYGDDVNGYYGTEGDYINSLRYMVGEMENGNGFLVFNSDNDCLCEMDGFASDYEAQVGAEQWIKENASQYITASVKTSMDEDFGGYSFWGETKINAPYVNNAYQMFYGEYGNKDKSLTCQAWRSEKVSDMYESKCMIKAPDFTTLDSTMLPSWKECKQWFKDYCQNNIDFIDRTLRTSSIKNANANWTYWNEYLNPLGYTCLFYGVRESPLKSIVITLPEKDGMYKYEIADNSSIHDIAESDYIFSDEQEAFDEADAWVQEHAGEYLQKYEQQYAYSSHITADEDSLSNDLDDMNEDNSLYDDDLDTEVPDAIASIKKSTSELTFWGQDINDTEGTELYGIENDFDNSLYISGEVSVSPDGEDQDCTVMVQYPIGNGYYGSAYQTDGYTLDDCLRNAEEWCINNAQEYLNLDNTKNSSYRHMANKTFKTAKRKWTARERLALINEEKLIDDDDFDDLI